ncbi:MAG TPA: GNVR domain-containing protein [Pyrinomonadaceae bacterium]|jgi:polysaccharide chain length determinant protein (PEP-CTERM system associated)|nr:GNVR domain-containing protein [Pyrinomonadaceae bacterium]
MSAEFRQRTPAEYLKILRRRKWLIILPVFAVAIAASYVIYKLPDVYKSSTLIVVKPSTLPQSVVPQGTEDALTRQLSGISQVVTSRSSLEPLVEKYELYAMERRRGEPMESIIAMVRNDIKVDVNTSRNDITNGFDISYRYRDPRIAQAVTTELAGKYISVQAAEQVNDAKSALQFINNQAEQTKGELDGIDSRRLEFMKQNLPNLPSNNPSLLGQLTGLREEKTTLITEIGRLQDRRSSLASQLGLMQKSADQMIGDAAEQLTDPKSTPAWAELVKRKADLQGELQQLKTQLKPKHPDVIAKEAQIDSVNKDMDLMLADWKARIEERRKRLTDHPDLQISAMKLEIGNLDSEIVRQQKQLGETDKMIASISDRINAVPGAEVALQALDREYETKKTAYDKLLDEQQKIALSTQAAQEQQAQGIAVIDPANLPAKPVAPKRLLLVAMAVAAGLALGLLLAGIFEIPLLLTIQTTEDARHYTGLPVLIAVPELMTPQEARSLPRRRRLLLAAGVVATIVSIPLLALALRLTHVFEFLMQSSGRA